MTEAEWLACTDPQEMLWFLRGKPSDRKLRLFSCACSRRVWHQMTDWRSRAAVEVAERYADAHATGAELQAAGDAVPLGRPADNLARDAADLGCSASLAIDCALESAAARTRRATGRALAQLLRELVQPFPTSPAINSECLSWQGGTVVRLAQAAYEERQLPSGHLDNARLAVLADALEEAGCDNADILTHLRGPGPHVRGCWALDRLLGKS
jgi:hypothetical protein